MHLCERTKRNTNGKSIILEFPLSYRKPNFHSVAFEHFGFMVAGNSNREVPRFADYGYGYVLVIRKVYP